MRLLLHIVRGSRGIGRLWLLLGSLALIHGPLTLAVPLVEKYLIDSVLLPRRLDQLPLPLLAYAVLWVAIQVNSGAVGVLNAYLSERLSMRLREQLFAHCQSLSLAFAQREHSGRTMALFTSDVPTLTGFANTTLSTGLASVSSLLVGTVVVLRLNWQFGVTVFIALPLITLAVAVATRPLRWASRRVQDKVSDLNEHLQETLAGMREVVAFGQERPQRTRFLGTMGELLNLRMRLTRMDTAIQAGRSAISLAISLVILGLGGYLVIEGRTSLGTVIAMRSLYQLMYAPALELLSLIGSAQKASASADRIREFLAEAPHVHERANARSLTRVDGVVTFDNVCFGYQPDRPVLRDICLTALPGQTVALVGPSGAGKTTLVNLVGRLYDPTTGRVLLDGTDIRELTLASVRQSVAMVFQDTFLFAMTMRENIAFGNPTATEAEVIAAARAANAWEFIERLPDGLATQVGERGVWLSEGQKQRLAIARALLRNARILILDEPTSALDARSEHLLQTALENVMRGRTTFVIAHRLATILRADQILVIDDGRIVERGCHAQLIRSCGLYRQMFDLQFGGGTATDALLANRG